MENWRQYLKAHFLEPELLDEIETHSKLVEVPKGNVLLKAGDFVAGVPIVLQGLIKVERVEELRELLLYYIKPGESCIMSFASITQDSPSQVIAIAEQDSVVLFLPKKKLLEWNRRYPGLKGYFLQLFQSRYQGLIHTIDQLAFQRLDQRLFAHLKQKSNTLNTNDIHMTHQEIADELGSSREVISRALKKLEKEGKLLLGRNLISLL